MADGLLRPCVASLASCFRSAQLRLVVFDDGRVFLLEWFGLCLRAPDRVDGLVQSRRQPAQLGAEGTSFPVPVVGS